MPERDYGIADLLLQSGQSQARSLRELGAAKARSFADIGTIQARGIEARGQRMADLAQNLGKIGTQAVGGYLDQREQTRVTDRQARLDQQKAQSEAVKAEQERVKAEDEHRLSQQNSWKADKEAQIAGLKQLAGNVGLYKSATPEARAQLWQGWTEQYPQLKSVPQPTDDQHIDAITNSVTTEHERAQAQLDSLAIAEKTNALHGPAAIEGYKKSIGTLMAAVDPAMLADPAKVAQMLDGLAATYYLPPGADRAALQSAVAQAKMVDPATLWQFGKTPQEIEQHQTAPTRMPNAEGLTPSQSATDAREKSRIANEGARITIDRSKEARAKETFDLTYGTAPSEPGGATTPVNNTARMIAEYRLPAISPRAAASGPGKALMDEVGRINPDYDGTQYANRSKTRQAWTSGTQGQQINAMNTAIGHMDQLSSILADLNNSDTQVKNRAFNWLKTQFGDASVTNFDTLKDALAGEIDSILAKGQSTVSGRADAKSHITSAQSPEQLAGYVKTQIPILGSKLASLDYQYHQAMGEKDPFQALSPEAKAVLSKHGFDPKHPTQQSGGGDGSVVMTNPVDGKKYNVPAAGVDAAKARGWK